jgi:hypothetical protein
MEKDYDKIMREYHESIKKERVEQSRKDNEILAIVQGLVSDNMFCGINECLRYSECTSRYEICDNPVGQFQEEDYSGINGIWVSQQVGYVCDDYSGHVCIKLPNGKFFKFYYEM